MHRISRLVWPILGALCVFVEPTSAHANRFGPPWQSRVVVDRTTVFSQPDRASPAVGPLDRGQIVIVVGETKATDGTDWTHVPDGFLVSSDILEETTPWIAEVSVPNVSIYARPNAREPIRRTARQGALLRVTGISPGIDDDTAMWWATTEGYVGLRTLRVATSDWAAGWTLPDPEAAPGGWWGAIRSQANVRPAPTTKAPVVGTLGPGDRVKVLAEERGDAVGGNATWYRIDGGRYAGAVVHSSLVARLPAPKPVVALAPEDLPPGSSWIAVSRAAATLTYFAPDGTPAFTTYVSLGRAGVDTPEGDYETMGKYHFDTMSSATVLNAEHSYHLPNVPNVEYYRDGGYALHGTYWHDHFGLLESQGCVNLTWADSAYLFSLTLPRVETDELARWAINIPATPLRILN
jgi:lipoprotein-anchoring transpeptidase ErfK/SrfK